MRVISEQQGCARIFGRSQRAQAYLIIEHAGHPDPREERREQADLRGLQSRRTTA